MGNRFMPEESSGRLITVKAHVGEQIPLGGGTVNILVLNQTGKTILLTAFNAVCTQANALASADVRNAGGSMLTAAVDIGTAAGTAAAGTLHATNLTVASAGTITFRFINPAGAAAMLDSQATAYFTVVA